MGNLASVMAGKLLPTLDPVDDATVEAAPIAEEPLRSSSPPDCRTTGDVRSNESARRAPISAGASDESTNETIKDALATRATHQPDRNLGRPGKLLSFEEFEQLDHQGESREPLTLILQHFIQRYGFGRIRSDSFKHVHQSAIIHGVRYEYQRGSYEAV